MAELLGILFVQYPCKNDKIALLSPWLSLLSQTVDFLRKKSRFKILKSNLKRCWDSIRAENSFKKILCFDPEHFN